MGIIFLSKKSLVKLYFPSKQNKGLQVCKYLIPTNRLTFKNILPSTYSTSFSWPKWTAINVPSGYMVILNLTVNTHDFHWILHYVKSVQIRSFFWCLFSRIQTEYGEIRSISPHSVRMRENTYQKKFRIWTHFTKCYIRIITQSSQFVSQITEIT